MHLTEIEMNIKGDPYWLGKTNLERTIELDTLINSTPEGLNANRFGSRTDNFANYYDYDAHFLLLFRAGQPPDPATGFQNLDLVRNAEGAVTGSVYFAAVYQTIEVTHVFQNGQFTQKIKAIRDGLINLQGLRSIGTPATPEEPPAPVAPSLVPGAVLAAAPAETGSLIRNRGESTADFNRRVREAALATAQFNQQSGLRTQPTQPTPPMAPNE